jgi:hypothetical protein
VAGCSAQHGATDPVAAPSPTGHAHSSRPPHGTCPFFTPTPRDMPILHSLPLGTCPFFTASPSGHAHSSRPPLGTCPFLAPGAGHIATMSSRQDHHWTCPQGHPASTEHVPRAAPVQRTPWPRPLPYGPARPPTQPCPLPAAQRPRCALFDVRGGR